MTNSGKPGTVDFCGIEKGAAVFICLLDRLNTVTFRRNLPVAMRKSHTSHTYF